MRINILGGNDLGNGLQDFSGMEGVSGPNVDGKVSE